MLAEQLHIDYHFSGLYDDGHEIYYDESDNDTDDGSESHDDGELSFDYGQNGPPQEVSALKNSMEVTFCDTNVEKLSVTQAKKYRWFINTYFCIVQAECGH